MIPLAVGAFFIKLQYSHVSINAFFNVQFEVSH